MSRNAYTAQVNLNLADSEALCVCAILFLNKMAGISNRPLDNIILIYLSNPKGLQKIRSQQFFPQSKRIITVITADPFAQCRK